MKKKEIHISRYIFKADFSSNVPKYFQREQSKGAK